MRTAKDPQAGLMAELMKENSGTYTRPKSKQKSLKKVKDSTPSKLETESAVSTSQLQPSPSSSEKEEGLSELSEQLREDGLGNANSQWNTQWEREGFHRRLAEKDQEINLLKARLSQKDSQLACFADENLVNKKKLYNEDSIMIKLGTEFRQHRDALIKEVLHLRKENERLTIESETNYEHAEAYRTEKRAVDELEEKLAEVSTHDEEVSIQLAKLQEDHMVAENALKYTNKAFHELQETHKRCDGVIHSAQLEAAAVRGMVREHEKDKRENEAIQVQAQRDMIRCKGELARVHKKYEEAEGARRALQEEYDQHLTDHQTCKVDINSLELRLNSMIMRHKDDILLRWGRRREVMLVDTSRELLKHMKPVIALKVTAMKIPGDMEAEDMGIFVESVLPLFPKHLNVKQYDVIDEINGVVLKTKREFFALVASLQPGQQVMIRTYRAKTCQVCQKKPQMRLSPHRCIMCGTGHDFDQRDLMTAVGAKRFTLEQVVSVNRLANYEPNDYVVVDALEKQIVEEVTAMGQSVFDSFTEAAEMAHYITDRLDFMRDRKSVV